MKKKNVLEKEVLEELVNSYIIILNILYYRFINANVY